MTNLKRIREEMGLTQKALALAANVDQGSIKAYEQGRRSINLASAESVYRLSKALGCDVNELLEKKASDLGKQWAVALYDYGIAELDLSRCEQEVDFIKRLTWEELKNNPDLESVVDAIIKNGAIDVEEDSTVEIYRISDSEEEYEIYVPEWWD